MNKVVKLFEVDNDADSILKGSVHWDGSKITFAGDPNTIRFVKEETMDGPKKVSPADGESFLDAVYHAYGRGSRFYATKPQEVE